MAFADDLLEQAYHLASRDPVDPTQANLRRAVSTAYYALFHYLIGETVANWAVARHRAALSRTFDHKQMKAACESLLRTYYSAGKPESRSKIKNVAEAFANLQDARHIADYDVSVHWQRVDSITLVSLARDAFEDWRAIRNDDSAQDFLLSLFLPRAAEKLARSANRPE